MMVAGVTVIIDHRTPQKTEHISLHISLSVTPAALSSSAVISNEPPVFVIDNKSLERTVREVIQTVLKQELSSYVRQPMAEKATSTDIDSSRDVKENTAINSQAFAEVSAVVDRAIALGVWTANDNMIVSSSVTHLTLEQRREVLDKVVRAINGQRLKIKGPFPTL